VESYVDSFDFEAMVLRLSAYSIVIVPPLPNTNNYTRQLNILARNSKVLGGIIWQYMLFNAPDEFNEAKLTPLSDPQAVSSFVKKFEDDVTDYVFKDLTVTGTIKPQELSDLYLSERNQSNIAKQAQPFGVNADDVTNIAVTFNAGGKEWLFLPSAIRYNNRWYLWELMGNLSSLLGLTPYTGGIGPRDLITNPISETPAS
jgi:hypothetical protein